MAGRELDTMSVASSLTELSESYAERRSGKVAQETAKNLLHNLLPQAHAILDAASVPADHRATQRETLQNAMLQLNKAGQHKIAFIGETGSWEDGDGPPFYYWSCTRVRCIYKVNSQARRRPQSSTAGHRSGATRDGECFSCSFPSPWTLLTLLQAAATRALDEIHVQLGQDRAARRNAGRVGRVHQRGVDSGYTARRYAREVSDGENMSMPLLYAVVVVVELGWFVLDGGDHAARVHALLLLFKLVGHAPASRLGWVLMPSS
ncbi:hypothetical protein MKEN_00718100 [Mycena kentingensis (nom. inval.)]|nr:hypothetical protein MKEN_00718100 [Mycena kentingensis (nom. inval.)]